MDLCSSAHESIVSISVSAADTLDARNHPALALIMRAMPYVIELALAVWLVHVHRVYFSRISWKDADDMQPTAAEKAAGNSGKPVPKYDPDDGFWYAPTFDPETGMRGPKKRVEPPAGATPITLVQGSERRTLMGRIGRR